MKSWKIVVILLVAVAGFAISGAYSRFGKQPTVTVEGVQAEADKSGLTYLKALKEALPAEYEKFMTEYVALANKGASAEETAAFSTKSLADIRRRYAASVRKADPALVQSALQAKRELFELVKANETPQDCASWIMTDTMTPAMQAKRETYGAPADRFSAAVVRAQGAGEKSPVDIGAATPDDWKIMGLQYVAGGGAVADLQEVLGTGAINPQACEVYQRLFQIVSDVPGEPGQRLRAEIMNLFVSYE
ncbi:hypothetical protein [Mesorhizobium sp. 1M-11]|uniref:hypothetical protein n=1 Tax=Mesorhizobium sp. 1M-11 TaxID=1529006 RepID=UPI0006C75823|nr:hypothetical protein [Mesorhizobium sp. 1M-11]